MVPAASLWSAFECREYGPLQPLREGGGRSLLSGTGTSSQWPKRMSCSSCSATDGSSSPPTDSPAPLPPLHFRRYGLHGVIYTVLSEGLPFKFKLEVHPPECLRRDIFQLHHRGGVGIDSMRPVAEWTRRKGEHDIHRDHERQLAGRHSA